MSRIQILAPFTIRKATPTSPHIFSCMFWMVGNIKSLAARQREDDGKWYVTEGYDRGDAVGILTIAGPFESLEQIEMLFDMGVLDV